MSLADTMYEMLGLGPHRGDFSFDVGSVTNPETVQDIINDRYGHIVSSVTKIVPEAVGHMSIDEKLREAQVANVVKKSDVLGGEAAGFTAVGVDTDSQTDETTLPQNPEAVINERSAEHAGLVTTEANTRSPRPSSPIEMTDDLDPIQLAPTETDAEARAREARAVIAETAKPGLGGLGEQFALAA